MWQPRAALQNNQSTGDPQTCKSKNGGKEGRKESSSSPPSTWWFLSNSSMRHGKHIRRACCCSPGLFVTSHCGHLAPCPLCPSSSSHDLAAMALPHTARCRTATGRGQAHVMPPAHCRTNPAFPCQRLTCFQNQ